MPHIASNEEINNKKNRKDMTLKRKRLIDEIPKCRTLREAGLKAGYTSLDIYRPRIRAHIREAMCSSPEKIKAHYDDLLYRCREAKDLSTERATLQDMGRINAMFKDKHEINVMQSLPPEKITPELINEAKQALENKS